MKPRVDPTFVQCCKEEIADGQAVTIVVRSRRDIPAYQAAFTDEELDYVQFEIGSDR